MKTGMKHIALMTAVASAISTSTTQRVFEPEPHLISKTGAAPRRSASKFKFAGNDAPKNQRQRRKLDRQVPQRRRA